MKTLFGVALLLAAMPLHAAYQYYYSDAFPSINAGYWNQNGQITASNGITSSSAVGGALISKIAVPDGTATYEVRTTLALTTSGGVFTTYMRASTDALAGNNAGTYYAVELQNPTFSGNACTATLAVNERKNGVVTALIASPVTCHNGMVIRTVYALGDRIAVKLTCLDFLSRS